MNDLIRPRSVRPPSPKGKANRMPHSQRLSLWGRCLAAGQTDEVDSDVDTWKSATPYPMSYTLRTARLSTFPRSTFTRTSPAFMSKKLSERRVSAPARTSTLLA